MLVGFTPKNHPQQVGVRGANDGVDTRETPLSLLAPLIAEFGPFTLDVAASALNTKAPRYFDIAADGLVQSWAGERVWCNPPYSNLLGWVAKASREHRDGCPLIVMLLPANRTEQPWWQDQIEPYRDGRGSIETRFIRKRVDFGKPVGSKAGSVPFASVLAIWGTRS